MKRLTYLVMLALALAGCSEFEQAVKDAKKETPPPPKDNYIILLDLSDRILTNNQQQVPKDIFVVQSIYKAFRARLEAKDPTRLFYTVNDKLKVLVAPQRNTPRDIYNMAGDLRIALAGVQPEQKAHLIEETERKFDSLLPVLYKKAVISNNSKDYPGADIWRYFNEDLAGDLEPDATNTLFIITDGYLDFEPTEMRPVSNNRYTSCSQIIKTLRNQPDWQARFESEDYGLLPVKKKFSNLKVVLLEVNPKDEWPGEFTLLTDIWSKWLEEMGITSYSFIKDDNVNELNESIEKLMEVSLPGNKQKLAWTAVMDIDPALVAQDSLELATLKKKVLTTEIITKNILTDTIASITVKDKSNPPLKRSVKQKQEAVTFGPVY
jgi:hypothetical protein